MAVNSNPPVQLDPSQDQAHQIAFINQNFQNLANSLSPFILSDGTNNRLLIGKDSVSNYVVKISKAGFDAFNAADTNLIFNSNQDVFKIGNKGTASIPGFSFGTNATTGSLLTIAHGQSFAPIVDIYVQTTMFSLAMGVLAVSYVRLPVFVSSTGINLYYFPGNSGNNYPLTVLYGVDSTNIYIQASYFSTTNTGSVNAIPVTYFILQETAN